MWITLLIFCCLSVPDVNGFDDFAELIYLNYSAAKEAKRIVDKLIEVSRLPEPMKNPFLEHVKYYPCDSFKNLIDLLSHTSSSLVSQAAYVNGNLEFIMQSIECYVHFKTAGEPGNEHVSSIIGLDYETPKTIPKLHRATIDRIYPLLKYSAKYRENFQMETCDNRTLGRSGFFLEFMDYARDMKVMEAFQVDRSYERTVFLFFSKSFKRHGFLAKVEMTVKGYYHQFLLSLDSGYHFVNGKQWLCVKRT